MNRIARIAATAAVLALAGCSSISAPSSFDSEDLAWQAGCGALSVGITAQGVKRTAQIEVLNTVVDSSGLPKAQRAWAKQGVGLLAYEDVRKAPKSLRRAAGAPCAQHGHRIAALG